MDKLVKKTNLALVIGTNSWREQFRDAITVNPGETTPTLLQALYYPHITAGPLLPQHYCRSSIIPTLLQTLYYPSITADLLLPQHYCRPSITPTFPQTLYYPNITADPLLPQHYCRPSITPNMTTYLLLPLHDYIPSITLLPLLVHTRLY